jgi:hypothetical protein
MHTRTPTFPRFAPPYAATLGRMRTCCYGLPLSVLVFILTCFCTACVSLWSTVCVSGLMTDWLQDWFEVRSQVRVHRYLVWLTLLY